MKDSANTDLLEYILIVDDQPQNLKILAEILEAKGYKTKKAIDGETAILAANAQPPDLILLDIKMPQMDGYEVCKKLKSNPNTAEIPIIFLTALDEISNKIKAFSLGGSDYITKPFQIEEVLARITAQLTIKRQNFLLTKEIEKRQIKEQELLLEIAKRQESEEILYQSRALLSGVLNSSLDGIAALQSVRNSDGKIVDFRCLLVNPVLAQKLGRDKKILTGKILFKKIVDKIDTHLFNQFVQLVESGNCLEKDILYHVNEQELWYHFIAVKLGDGFAITIRDINDRKRMELALKNVNQKLENLANLDGLTQIPNRRYFDQVLQNQWQWSQAEEKPLSLILCDVDYFKQYNDTYGHLAGDECLIQVAKAIEKATRRHQDIVARYGGEEFAILLTNTPQEIAIKVGNRIREEVKNLKISHIQSTVSPYVTISLGITTIVQCPSPENLVAAADRALYLAKSQGRDRLVWV